MPILAPATTGASSAQVPDHSPVSFNDSLLTASKAYSEAGSKTSIGPKATPQAKSASEDSKTSPAIPAGRAIQSPNVSQSAVLQQQPATAQQAPLTSTAVPPIELPLVVPGSISDATTASVGGPILNSEAGWTAGTESPIVQSGVAESVGNPSKCFQLNSAILARGPISSGSTTKGTKALPVTPSTMRNSVSDGGGTAPSIADSSVILNPVLNPEPEKVANSLPQSALNAVASVAPNTSSNAALDKIQIAVPDAPSNATSYGIQNPLSSAAPEKAANSFSQSTLNAVASVAPNASSNTASDTIQIVVPGTQSNATSNEIQSPLLNTVPEEVANSLLQSALNAAASVAPNASLNAASNPVPIAVSTATSSELQSSFLKTVLKTFASVVPNGLTNAASNTAAPTMADNDQSSDLSAVHNAVANTVHNEVPNVAVNQVSNTPLNAGSVSIAHAALPASPKEVVVPVASSASANRPVASPSSPDQTIPATGLSVPEPVIDPLAAQNTFTGGPLVPSQAGLSDLNSTSVAKLSAISSANGKIGSTDATDDASGLKQHAPSASDLTTSQAGSQQTTPSVGQTQVGASSQAQGAATSQVNLASHAAVDGAHTQSATITSPVQTSPTPGANAGHAATAPDKAAPVLTAAPEAPPFINTAKLIQSVGQTEMRVGMRSNEFGNISISTSATRDSISAQISLDHGELAKTLAAHLPEIEARLSTNQSVDVRIDTNGARGGLGTGTSGSFSGGSTGDSRGGGQQTGNAASSYSGNVFSDRQFSPAAATVTTNNDGINARLDIRV